MHWRVDLSEAKESGFKSTQKRFISKLRKFGKHISKLEILCPDGVSESLIDSGWCKVSSTVLFASRDQQGNLVTKDEHGEVVTVAYLPTKKNLSKAGAGRISSIYEPAKFLSMKGCSKQLCSPKQYAAFVNKNVDLHTKPSFDGDNIGFHYITACLYGWSNMCTLQLNCQQDNIYVDSKGHVYPCEALKRKGFKFGNIFEDRLEDILLSPRRKIFFEKRYHAKPDFYHTDLFPKWNRGCPAMAMLEGKEFFDSSDFDYKVGKKLFPIIEEMAPEDASSYSQAPSLSVADIKLGYSCNNNCIHCVIMNQARDRIKNREPVNLTFAEVKELVANLDEHYSSIVITGGEPTIRKDIVDIVKYMKKKKYHLYIQSNGRKFCDENFAGKLSGYDLSFAIPIHGSSARLHDKISGRKGSFAQTVQGIKNLVKYGNHVNGKIIVSKLNMSNMPSIIKLYEKLGVKIVNIAFPHGEGNAWENREITIPKLPALEPVIKWLEDYQVRRDMLGHESKIDFEAVPLCYLDGKEMFASEIWWYLIHKGDYVSKPLTSDYFRDWDADRLESKMKFASCCECSYDSVCEGVYKEYVRYYKVKRLKPIGARKRGR